MKRRIEDLYQLQALPLALKVKMTQARIREWVNEYGTDGVYISFSGGKDSCVLLDIVRNMYPDIKAVFIDTGLEFPELRDFVSTFDNVEIIRPKHTFRDIIYEYGYPIISKEVCEAVSGGRRFLNEVKDALLEFENTGGVSSEHRVFHYPYYFRKVCGIGEYFRKTSGNSKMGGWQNDTQATAELISLINTGSDSGRLININEIVDILPKPTVRFARCMGWLDENNCIRSNITTRDKSRYNCAKYKFMLTAPFNVSNRCCTIFKKNPAHSFSHKNGLKPMTAQMASESTLRTQKWLDNGCNGFDMREPISNPMSFWFDQDCLAYIVNHNLKLANVYGQVVTDAGDPINSIDEWAGIFDDRPLLKTTGVERSGCMFCLFGAHLEKESRLELIKAVSNKNILDYVMRGGDFDQKDGLWKPTADGLGYWFVIEWMNTFGNIHIHMPDREYYLEKYMTDKTRELLNN